MPALRRGLRRLRLGAVLAGGVLFGLLMLGLGAWWSWQPAPFDVQENLASRLGPDVATVPGAVTVAAVTQVASTLLDKQGGYLSNDLSLPGYLLDDMPAWESGVLKEVRDSVRALRNDFSRSQSQSVENRDLRSADAYLNYDSNSWLFPSTEAEFAQGIEALERYLAAMVAGTDRSARFYVRADNLAAYLAVVEKRLGSYAVRLSSSVGDRELTAALVPESLEVEGEAPSQHADPWPRTPGHEVDDVFHEARGYVWALLHVFRGLAVDFELVLRDKNAGVSVRRIILDLEEATRRFWSPVVLNGSGYGLINNHSLVLASYISRANAAILDLRMLLQQG
jgi:hypothetical protein